MQEGDENSDIIEECSTDASATGYDHFVWAPKVRLQKCDSGVNERVKLLELFKGSILSYFMTNIGTNP